MSFFKKVLSSVGIGSAKVDLIVEKPQLMPGEMLRGVVQVKGGSTQQHINKIELALCCNYFSEETYTETDDEGDSTEHTRTVEHTAVLGQLKLSESFDVAPDQELEFEVEFELPTNTPLSLGCCHVWIVTDLDIDYALDKSDKDFLDITPTPRQHAVLNGMNELGFVLGEVECEQSKQLGGSFVQEFEFKATNGDFAGRVDEVEILMVNHQDQLQILVEVDRKARGFGGFLAQMLGQDESRVWLEINDYEHRQVCDVLYRAIADNC